MYLRTARTSPDSSVGDVIRAGAERALILVIVSFVIAVVGTRWFLQATGYPQVGGGELHVAHMLWGGLMLIAAALLGLVVQAGWVTTLSAILTGAGTGLFIDEVGKFITASNDYFYPLAAPLIYGLFLSLMLLLVAVRQRRSGGPAAPDPALASSWETAHLPRKRYRRILVALLLLIGIGWVVSLVLFLALDSTTLRQLIDSVAHVPGDRVERPDQLEFYLLEAGVLGLSGILLITGAVTLGRGRETLGVAAAVSGLAIALTAGALLSLYVEQISAIASTLIHAALLIAVLHYRGRFLVRAAPDATDRSPVSPVA